MDQALQEQLINWGYAVCDAALRSRADAPIGTAGAISVSGPACLKQEGDVDGGIEGQRAGAKA